METLAARVAHAGGLRDTDAVGWVVRLAKRVERMHARGTVHGRISPECVVMQSEACTSKGWLSDPLQTPVLVSYRSPERAAGEGASRRDDTWALAVTLYEALSAKLPFAAETDQELLGKIRAGAPPALGAGNEALQRILARAFALDPAQRIVEIADLRRALEAWRPSAKLDLLPPLDEPADPTKPVAALPDDDDEVDDEARTLMRPDVIPALRQLLAEQAASPPKTTPPKTTPPAAGGSSASSQPPRLASPLPARMTSSQPPRITGAAAPATETSPPPPQRASSRPPHSGAASPPRRTPLMGLSSMALRQTFHAITTPVPSKAPEDEAVPAAPAAGTDDTPQAVSTAPPAAAVPLDPAPIAPSDAAPPPVALESGAAPARARDLPSLVDEEMPPEPSDPFAIAPYSAWTHVGAPEQGPRPSVTSAAPEPAPPPRAAPRRRWGLAALAAGAAIAASGVAAWPWLKGTANVEPRRTLDENGESAAATGLSAAPAACAAPPPVTAPLAGASTASTDVSAAPATSAAPPTEASEAGFAACMLPLFASSSIDAAAAARLSFVCSETNPLKGAAAVRAHLVKAAKNRGVSDATKEWAVLGWYEMAAFTVIRAQCCPSPPPLELPKEPGSCTPLAKALNELGDAVAATTGPGDRALEKSVKRFARSIQCTVRVGAASRYGRRGKPDGGEQTGFKKTLARVIGQKR
jgi:eukaryotic-like serine/threonine-protein kinase